MKDRTKLGMVGMGSILAGWGIGYVNYAMTDDNNVSFIVLGSIMFIAGIAIAWPATRYLSKKLGDN